MSREIKFQYVWQDGNSFIKELFTLDEIEQGKQWETFTDTPLLRNYRCIARREFTGRFDKNKEAIYENDIISGYFYAGIGETFKGTFKVEYSDTWASFGVEINSYWVTIGNADIYVVGNIYENPELLHHRP